MRILVTGKNGFIAKNVETYFTARGHNVVGVSHDESAKLAQECKLCDFVFHLAAVQRSSNEVNFWRGNVEYTRSLIDELEANDNKCPVLFSTSTGIRNPSVFAETKLEAERLLREHSERTGALLYVYMLNHIFGPYGKPNFNNVIATFCYNLANGKPLIVNDPSIKLDFTYVDDLMKDFERCVLGEQECQSGYLEPTVSSSHTLGDIVALLGQIKTGRHFDCGFEQDLMRTSRWYCGGGLC